MEKWKYVFFSQESQLLLLKKKKTKSVQSFVVSPDIFHYEMQQYNDEFSLYNKN
jgi:hypothetical protein